MPAPAPTQHSPSAPAGGAPHPLGWSITASAAAVVALGALWFSTAAALTTPPAHHHTGALLALLPLMAGLLLALAYRVATLRTPGPRPPANQIPGELAIDAVSDGLYDIDLATGRGVANPRYYSMLGYAPNGIPVSLAAWLDLVYPQDRNTIVALEGAYRTGQAEHHSIELRLRARDGSWRWILSRGRIVARDTAGRPLRLVGTHIDIDERKQAELALRAAKDFAEKLIDTANALVVGLDSSGRIIVFNATAEAVTGYTAAELAGRNWFETIVPHDRYPAVWAEFERLQSGGVPAHFENPILTRDGRERIVIWRNSVLREQGRPASTISFGIDVTEARRTEHALAQERDLVARLVETSPSGILVVDASGLIIFANPEAERILDLRRLDDPDHNYGRPTWALFNPDGTPVPESDRTFRQVLATGQPVRNVRHLLRWNSGRALLLSINAAPLLDQAGEIEAVVATLDDVTDRQHSEDLLRENEERLRSIVDHAPFGSHLFELQTDGRLLLQAANHPADSILHLDHQPLLGRDIADAFPQLRTSDLPDTYRRVVADGRSFHSTRLHFPAGQPGAIFDVHALPLGRNRVVVFFFDITERERSAAALRLSEERYRHLFNAGNDAILVHGFTADSVPDRFIQVNDIACQLLGLPRETLLTLTPLDITPAEQRNASLEAVALLLRERHVLSETELLAADGRRIPAEVNSSLLELDGRTTNIAIVRDVTERHRLEDQLRQSQKLEVFGQLAGGVAHDFNNLLVAIIGNAELLAETATDSRQHEQAAQIAEASHRAAALTRQLLLFARKQPPQPVPCDLGTIVSEHAKLLRRLIGENIALVLEPSTTPLPIVADINMVEQVAMNLVVNARDAMPRGGTLTLRTAHATLDPAEAARSGCPSGEYAALLVRDTGCGIPAAIRQRIFEPFFTTKEAGHGTGLGLSTVLGIVQQHRGGIALESSEGVGTQFSIYLPLDPCPEPTSAPAAAAPATPAPEPAPASILIVEDDAAVRAIVQRTLQLSGYHVLLATCGAEGLAQLESHADGIDLVLSDIVMPGEPDGAQLAEIAADRWPSIPVQLMSGYSKDLGRPETRILRKPFTASQLLAFVREGLATPHTTEGRVAQGASSPTG